MDRFLAVFALIFAFSGPILAGPPPHWCVRVLCFDDADDIIDSKGSGSLISARHVITNNHVIKDARKVVIRFPDFSDIECRIIKKDEKLDLALLETVALTYKNPVEVASRSRLGQQVFVRGYGQGIWGEGSGILKKYYHKNKEDIGKGKRQDYIWTIGYPCRPGDSGGPITNLHDQLIGVTFGSVKKNKVTAGIRIEAVIDFTDEFIKWKIKNEERKTAPVKNTGTQSNVGKPVPSLRATAPGATRLGWRK